MDGWTPVLTDEIKLYGNISVYELNNNTLHNSLIIGQQMFKIFK